MLGCGHLSKATCGIVSDGSSPEPSSRGSETGLERGKEVKEKGERRSG